MVFAKGQKAPTIIIRPSQGGKGQRQQQGSQLAKGGKRNVNNGYGGGGGGDYGTMLEPFIFLGASSRRRKMELMGLLGNQGVDHPLGSFAPAPAIQAASKRARQAAPLEEEEPPVCAWINVPDDALVCLEHGLPAGTVAAVHGKWLANKGLLGGATGLLTGLIDGEVKDEIEIIHDSENELWPEIAEAIQQTLGEKHSVAVAVCKSKCQWGMGLATNWKKRESSAKLALALAMLPESEDCAKLCGEWPELAQLCEMSGIVTGVEAPPMATKSINAKPQIIKPPNKKSAAPEPVAALGSLEDSVKWLNLPLGASILSERGLQPGAPCIVHSAQLQASGLISYGTQILNEILKESVEEVELVHDAEWKDHPEVGAALIEAGGVETSLCLAIHPGRAAWAVGAAGQWKLRESVSKLALCVALLPEAEDVAGILSQWPQLATLCEMSGIELGLN